MKKKQQQNPNKQFKQLEEGLQVVEVGFWVRWTLYLR